MSVIKSSPYKNPGCGIVPMGVPRDILGGYVQFQIVGTDPNIIGVKTGASITNGTGDYSPPPGYSNFGTFKITIESDNQTYIVTLEDGTDFTITPVQAHRFLGEWYPANLLSVNVGTTGDFSVGY